MITLSFLAAVTCGYLLGSANTSLIVSRFYDTDVRAHGSGNAGATNMLRVLGKKAATITTVGDTAKGVVSFLIGRFLLQDSPSLAALGGLAAGSGAIIGHNWPLFFQFRGGKGIWTSFAVALSFDWRIGLALLSVFAVVFALSRMVSLAAIVAAVLLPLIVWLCGSGPVATSIFSALAVLAVVRHYPNIRRILEGRESRIGGKKA
jgi:glycerol-3-phosphate acyltransferase PlsY